MKIYLNNGSPNCRKVRAVNQHLDLGIEEIAVDIPAGEQRKPEFLALNPNGRVPVLQDGDETLWESNAIMARLCAEKETTLWPKSEARYDILRWQFWQTAHFGPACDTYTWENVLKSLLGLGSPDAAALKAARPKFEQAALVLEQQLVGKNYVTGSQLTLADFSVAAPLTYAGPAQIPLDGYPEIQRWLNALNEVPAWRNTAPSL